VYRSASRSAGAAHTAVDRDGHGPMPRHMENRFCRLPLELRPGSQQSENEGDHVSAKWHCAGALGHAGRSRPEAAKPPSLLQGSWITKMRSKADGRWCEACQPAHQLPISLAATFRRGAPHAREGWRCMVSNRRSKRSISDAPWLNLNSPQLAVALQSSRFSSLSILLPSKSYDDLRAHSN
jgi:hypothetical protein